MNFAIILSAGSGTRFKSGADPKQFFELNGRPMLLHSLDAFQESEVIDKILVVSRTDLLKKTKEMVSSYSKCIGVIEGGDRRQDSVFNALEHLKASVTSNDKVLIHDSARPFCSLALITKLCNAAIEHEAVIPVLRSDDTLKELDNNFVIRTLDRNIVFRVQTPQIFDFKLIYECYNKTPKDVMATDDASLIEYNGHKVFCVEGERSNIKVTYFDDLKVKE